MRRDEVWLPGAQLPLRPSQLLMLYLMLVIRSTVNLQERLRSLYHTGV